jgi:hypothetical protein
MLRRIIFPFLVLPALVAGMPRVAHGQVADFSIQCMLSPFQACATVSIEAIYHPPAELFFGSALGVSELRFTLENMTGQPGYEVGASGLRAVRINNLNYVTGTGVDFFAEAIGSTGTATIGGTVDFPNIGYSGGFAWAAFNLDYDSFLFGCNVPVGASPFSGYDQTCGGTITYAAYFVNDHLSLGNVNAELAWTGWTENADYFADAQPGFSCTTGVDCAHVTPEPVTMTLLGSGLVSLAGARALRRRKRNENEIL